MKKFSRNKNNLLVLAFVFFGTLGVLSLFLHLDGSMGGFWFYVMIVSLLLAWGLRFRSWRSPKLRLGRNRRQMWRRSPGLSAEGISR